MKIGISGWNMWLLLGLTFFSSSRSHFSHYSSAHLNHPNAQYVNKELCQRGHICNLSPPKLNGLKIDVLLMLEGGDAMGTGKKMGL